VIQIDEQVREVIGVLFFLGEEVLHLSTLSDWERWTARVPVSGRRRSKRLPRLKPWVCLLMSEKERSRG
jgi:hypothetical protein